MRYLIVIVKSVDGKPSGIEVYETDNEEGAARLAVEYAADARDLAAYMGGYPDQVHVIPSHGIGTLDQLQAELDDRKKIGQV